MGIASMVLGIVGLFVSFLPFWGLPIPIIGLILGIVGVRSESPNRGMAIAGIVLCSISLVISILMTVGLFAFLSSIEYETTARLLLSLGF